MIIDVSKNNVVTDWTEVKKAVEGVIIRCGYRGYKSGKIVADPKANVYAKACVANGIPIGFYFVSQALTEEEAEEEAEFTVRYVRKYNAMLPVFIDSEDGDGTAKIVRADGLTRSARTSVVKAFCEHVISYGLVGGVYASESWFKERLDYDQLTSYFIWCAKYGKNTGKPDSTVTLPKWDLHQYTSRGSVSGINGFVDLSRFRTAALPQSDKDNGGKLPVLRKGAKGTAVKVWQAIAGADIDGIFGAKTDAKTRQWQQEHGLAVDGIVGEKTWDTGLRSL